MKIMRNIVRIVIAAPLLTACAGTPDQESTGEYIDDIAITTKVKAALLKDPAVSGLGIEVETFKGRVQLSGFANSDLERLHAETLAESVEGVDEVENDIQLKY